MSSGASVSPLVLPCRLHVQGPYQPDYYQPLIRSSPEPPVTPTRPPTLPVGHELCPAARDQNRELASLYQDRDRDLRRDPLALSRLVRDSVPDADPPAHASSCRVSPSSTRYLRDSYDPSEWFYDENPFSRTRQPRVPLSSRRHHSPPSNESTWYFRGIPIPRNALREDDSRPAQTQQATDRTRLGLPGEGPPGETREERNKRVWSETREWFMRMSERQRGRPCGVLDEWGREKEGAQCTCGGWEGGLEEVEASAGEREEGGGGAGPSPATSNNSSNSRLNAAADPFVPPALRSPSSGASWTPPSTGTGSGDNKSVDGGHARASSPATNEGAVGEKQEQEQEEKRAQEEAVAVPAPAVYVFGGNNATASDPDSSSGAPVRPELEFRFRSEAPLSSSSPPSSSSGSSFYFRFSPAAVERARASSPSSSSSSSSAFATTTGY